MLGRLQRGLNIILTDLFHTPYRRVSLTTNNMVNNNLEIKNINVGKKHSLELALETRKKIECQSADHEA